VIEAARRKFLLTDICSPLDLQWALRKVTPAGPTLKDKLVAFSASC